VLELDPEHAAAVFGLGMVATAGGDSQATVEHFERALELQPEATAIHYPLGQAYRRLGDLDKAREHLQQRGEQEPLFPDPLGNQVARLAKGTAFEIVLALAKSADEYPDAEFLGFALSHFGDVKGAIEQLEQGLALRQQSDATPLEQGRIHYVLGGLLVNDDRDPEAVEQFRRALELAPELIDARVKLGNAYARLERYDDALAAYDAVLSKQPENPDVLLKRASLLMGLDRDGEARPGLEKLAELTPESSEVQIRLATILEKEQDVEGALARYRAASELELTPQERPRVHYGLASMLRQQEQYNEAVKEYQRALEADPEQVPALADLASLLAQLGRMREAALYYGLWVGLEPRNLPPRLAEATALIFSDQHQRARDRLETALDMFPGTVQVQDVLARHLAACPDRTVRDGARAVELAAAVLEKVPTPQSVETMAMAYAEAGRFAEAVQWQQELIDRLAQEENVPAEMTERLRKNLTLYEKGEACCAE
jgi:superkiller protein 3